MRRGDDHLRYGAQLVASFGRSIREGYMDSCTDTVAKLTGRSRGHCADCWRRSRRHDPHGNRMSARSRYSLSMTRMTSAIVVFASSG